MNIISNSLSQPVDSLSPSRLTVEDKASFRAWCHHFKLDIDNVSCLFGVSKPQVYKYIDMSLETTIRKPVVNACNLISLKGEEKATAFLRQKFESAKISWPSSLPIGN
jgi:hypothetical protein